MMLPADSLTTALPNDVANGSLVWLKQADDIEFLALAAQVGDNKFFVSLEGDNKFSIELPSFSGNLIVATSFKPRVFVDWRSGVTRRFQIGRPGSLVLTEKGPALLAHWRSEDKTWIYFDGTQAPQPAHDELCFSRWRIDLCITGDDLTTIAQFDLDENAG